MTAWWRTGSTGTPPMLPEIDESYSNSFTGAQLADHIGTPKASTKADNPLPPKKP